MVVETNLVIIKRYSKSKREVLKQKVSGNYVYIKLDYKDLGNEMLYYNRVFVNPYDYIKAWENSYRRMNVEEKSIRIHNFREVIRQKIMSYSGCYSRRNKLSIPQVDEITEEIAKSKKKKEYILNVPWVVPPIKKGDFVDGALTQEYILRVRKMNKLIRIPDIEFDKLNNEEPDIINGEETKAYERKRKRIGRIQYNKAIGKVTRELNELHQCVHLLNIMNTSEIDPNIGEKELKIKIKILQADYNKLSQKVIGPPLEFESPGGRMTEEYKQRYHYQKEIFEKEMGLRKTRIELYKKCLDEIQYLNEKSKYYETLIMDSQNYFRTELVNKKIEYDTLKEENASNLDLEQCRMDILKLTDYIKEPDPGENVKVLSATGKPLRVSLSGPDSQRQWKIFKSIINFEIASLPHFYKNYGVVFGKINSTFLKLKIKNGWSTGWEQTKIFKRYLEGNLSFFIVPVYLNGGHFAHTNLFIFSYEHGTSQKVMFRYDPLGSEDFEDYKQAPIDELSLKVANKFEGVRLYTTIRMVSKRYTDRTCYKFLW